MANRTQLLAYMLVGVALALGLAGRAHAQVDPFEGLSDDQALELLELLDEADAARDAGRWTEAISAYLRFLAVAPDPYVQLDLARAYAADGQLGEAHAQLIDLRTHPDRDIAHAARDELRALIDAHPARLRVNANDPNVRIRLVAESGDARWLPLGEFVDVDAGIYEVQARAPSREPYINAVELGLGQELTLPVILQPNSGPSAIVTRPSAVQEPNSDDETSPASQAAAPATPSEAQVVEPVTADAPRSNRATTTRNVLVAGGAAVTIGTAIGAGVLYGQVGSIANRFEAYPNEPGATLAELESIADDGRRKNTGALTLTAVSATAAVATVLVYVLMRDGDATERASRSRDQQRVRVLPSASGIEVRW